MQSKPQLDEKAERTATEAAKQKFAPEFGAKQWKVYGLFERSSTVDNVVPYLIAKSDQANDAETKKNIEKTIVTLKHLSKTDWRTLHVVIAPGLRGTLPWAFHLRLKMTLFFMEERLPIGNQVLKVANLRTVKCGVIGFGDNAIPKGEPETARGGRRSLRRPAPFVHRGSIPGPPKAVRLPRNFAKALLGRRF
jgi:hypothetical protein